MIKSLFILFQNLMSTSKSKPFVFSWQRFLIHCAILSACLFLGVLTWYISKPHSVRFYETKADEYLTVAVTPDIQIALDNSSSITVTNNEQLLMELFKGNVYFDSKNRAFEKLRIKIGTTTIENIGSRCSIRLKRNGSKTVSVADGQVKIQVGSDIYLLSALEQADFDDFKMSNHHMISEREVAPWHSDS